MKQNDVFIAISILVSKRTNVLPTFKDLSQITGLSISQCFDAIESLYEKQLLDSTRKSIDIIALEKFLIHALPFVLPAKILGPGKGLSLTLSDGAVMAPISSLQSTTWIWKCEEGQDFGMCLEPLHSHLIRILFLNPEWKDFFSCIEILRFKEHPLRAKAAERVRFWFTNFRENLSGEKKPIHNERLLEAAAKILAETGYRNLKFEKLASQLECSQEDLEKNFASPQSLISEVGRLCVSRANAHFGKMLLAAPENRKREAKESLRSFLQFLDTNEDYFRLGLWFYVEKMFQVTNTGHLTEMFFDKLEEFFESIPSEKSASSRAMLFANSWLTFAWFRWVEFPKMNENQRAKDRLKELENTLVALLD